MSLLVENHLAPLRLSKTGKNLGQLLLPVARDTGYAKDLAFTHGKRNTVQSQKTFVAAGGEVFYLEYGFPRSLPLSSPSGR